MEWLSALRGRQFQRLFAGRPLSSFGDTALHLTLGIPNAFAPLAGHLADRVRRKTLLIAVNAITALTVPSLLAVRSRNELWLIQLIAFCYGTSFDLLSATGFSLRTDMLCGEGLHRPAPLTGAVLSFQAPGPPRTGRNTHLGGGRGRVPPKFSPRRHR
jgi:MFS family permease